MSEESEDKSHRMDKIKSVSRKKAAIVLAAVVLVGAAIFVGSNMDIIQNVPGENDTSELEQTANDNTEEQEDVQRVGLNPSQIPGEITDVTVDDERADPPSPIISPEDGIRFVNDASVALEFSFDREIRNFELQPGESTIVNPESIVYYTANSVDESVEFREISARINVQ